MAPPAARLVCRAAPRALGTLEVAQLFAEEPATTNPQFDRIAFIEAATDDGATP